MKVVFIGGGSFRVLPLVRSALSHRKVFHKGEIRLVDIALDRAEAVGRLIRKTPECKGVDAAVSWTDDLDRALEGADLAYVSMAVGSPAVCRLGETASRKHGFIGSDNISVEGSFRALTGGRLIIDWARRMEKRCPDAMLLTFANPVAIYSAAVNNHTKIKCLGVCGGYGNHRWDLTRLLYGVDEYRDLYDVDVAGVNHCSFILRGTVEGKDLYETMGKTFARKSWKPAAVRHRHAAQIRYGLKRMRELYERFGVTVFSTEGDGMAHLFHEDMFRRGEKEARERAATRAQAAAYQRKAYASRAEADVRFRSFVDRDLDGDFWTKADAEGGWFARADTDVFIPILRALAGDGRMKVAASRPAGGDVKGVAARMAVELSLILDKKGARPASTDLYFPEPFHGLLSSLSMHQTLVGDAIATEDPRLLAHALYAYPIHQNTKAAKALWKDLLRIHKDEIPAAFQQARDYF